MINIVGINHRRYWKQSSVTTNSFVKEILLASAKQKYEIIHICLIPNMQEPIYALLKKEFLVRNELQYYNIYVYCMLFDEYFFLFISFK